LSEGEAADITHAPQLIDGYQPESVVAEKAYDSDQFVKKIESKGTRVVIPSEKNRKKPRSIDLHIYKQRNLLERFINKIKKFRRVATRYYKTVRNFLAFIHIAVIMILLKNTCHAYLSCLNFVHAI
jgi:putative transposase